MTYCVKCGEPVAEGVRYCPRCGAEIPAGETEHKEQGTQNQQGYTYYQGEQNGQQSGGYQYHSEEYFDPQEVRANKGMGVLSYFGILVLIPLLAGNRQSEYVRFHSNQGLVLFIVSVILDLLDGKWVWGFHSFLNFGGSIFSWIFDIAGFAVFILVIMGIVSACKGQKKELPLIGKVKILRK